MDIQQHVSLRGKTTMRIGSTALYFGEAKEKADIEQAIAFAQEKNLPLIVLGGGSNTIFDDEEIHALVLRIKADDLRIKGSTVEVAAGKILAVLINELADQNLDCSACTGIPGTLGGALFGNAGQGPKGIWLDTFVQNVTAYVDGRWRTFTHDECHFRYRESWFKDHTSAMPPVIWSAMLQLPTRPKAEILADIESLLKKRIETQPHRQTAGSCFKAVGETPAWKLIDAKGLRGHRVGGVEISQKHANFLLNIADGTFADAKTIVEEVRTAVDEPLEVEMRFVKKDGSLVF